MQDINIDYTNLTNKKALKIAQQIDNDGKKGLQGIEVFNFTKQAINNNIEKEDLAQLLGVTLGATKSPSKIKNNIKTNNPNFEKAVSYYNEKLDAYDRSMVTSDTYENLYTRLYNMEKAVDQAFMDCEAYQDIVIVPTWHYRYYPQFEDRLVNFDIEELRTNTVKDMNALHTLKDKIETIMEEANGEVEHKEPQRTEYDVDALALKHLGMSYDDFTKEYQEELEFCKHVTYADFSNMTERQAFVYGRAKAYAKDMLERTIEEAHTVNWNAGERKVDETLKATGDMYTISEFEDKGITEEGLTNINSGIMYKAFEDALISKYQESIPTGMKESQKEEAPRSVEKRIVNGQLLLFYSDGRIYNDAGQRIK